MPYPPPVLPTDRTNATPQQDVHPADHNAVNLAVNDIVNALGPRPAVLFDNNTWGGLHIRGGRQVIMTDATGVFYVGYESMPFEVSPIAMCNDAYVGFGNLVYKTTDANPNYSGFLGRDVTNGITFPSGNLDVMYLIMGRRGPSTPEPPPR